MKNPPWSPPWGARGGIIIHEVLGGYTKHIIPIWTFFAILQQLQVSHLVRQVLLNMVPGFKKVKLKGRRPKGFTIDSEGHVRRWISRLAAGRGRGRSWKRMTWKNKARPSYISATHLQYPSPDRDVSATKRVERLPAVGQCSASLAWT